MYGFKNLLNTFQSFEIRIALKKSLRTSTDVYAFKTKTNPKKPDRQDLRKVYSRRTPPYREIYSRSQRKKKG